LILADWSLRRPRPPPLLSHSTLAAQHAPAAPPSELRDGPVPCSFSLYTSNIETCTCGPGGGRSQRSREKKDGGPTLVVPGPAAPGTEAGQGTPRVPGIGGAPIHTAVAYWLTRPRCLLRLKGLKTHRREGGWCQQHLNEGGWMVDGSDSQDPPGSTERGLTAFQRTAISLGSVVDF